MELSENDDALKLTLAEPGFSSPELENSIRESLVKGKERFSAYFEQYHAFTSLHSCFQISRDEISSHYEMDYAEATVIHNHQGEGKFISETYQAVRS